MVFLEIHPEIQEKLNLRKKIVNSSIAVRNNFFSRTQYIIYENDSFTSFREKDDDIITIQKLFKGKTKTLTVSYLFVMKAKNPINIIEHYLQMEGESYLLN